MSFNAGTKLGVFEVSTLLGVGGMGEVYRARDTKLGRDVAIKILPEEFANDRDRLARFQREARLLAALNHPNIAHIHELQESDGVQFLVMELVGGETLADRIKKGPLEFAETYKLFGQIAEGLDAAHQQGVIHRDLKPANIKITDDGKVSVLDFGLAKAADAHSSSSGAEVTSPWNADGAGASIAGQVLGTPAYMSPEQARGKAVDKRTDIWAFGCCLFEALTGKRPFRGETASDTLAAILKGEPSWEELPTNTPARLRELLQSCLAKDSCDRLRDIGDARHELRRIADESNQIATTAISPRASRSRLVAASVLCLLTGSLTGAALWSLVRPGGTVDPTATGHRAVVRTTLELPAEAPIRSTTVGRLMWVPRFALSDDGLRLVYGGGKADSPMLYLRPMDRLVASPVPGTYGGQSPFFSPDGQWIGFFTGGKLKKIRIGESQPITLCEARNPAGAAWGRDGTIYFAESISQLVPMTRGLKRVRDSGGAPEWLTQHEDDASIIGHAFPYVLPDGKTLLFALTSYSKDSMSIGALTLATGRWKTVLSQASEAQYVPTGHLLFRREGSLYAARFDLDQLRVVGPAIPVFQSGLSPAFSESGCLVHAPSSLRESDDLALPPCPLVWVNLKGETEPLKAPLRPYFAGRLSPDGNRLAVTVASERGFHIWVYDIERNILSRLNLEGSSRNAVWMPDGQRVVFSSDHGGKAFNLFSAPAAGGGEPQRLTQSNANQFPTSISPDGRILAILQFQPTTGGDIYVLPLDGSGHAEPLIQTEFLDTGAAFSPDGRWLAYSSDETGRPEVFVQSYPAPTTKWQVSNQGGMAPRWSPKGDALFYRSDSAVFSVSIATDPEFKLGQPQLLFENPTIGASIALSYDVAPDGQRFILPGSPEADLTSINRLIVVQNWFEELKRLVPAEGAEEK